MERAVSKYLLLLLERFGSSRGFESRWNPTRTLSTIMYIIRPANTAGGFRLALKRFIDSLLSRSSQSS